MVSSVWGLSHSFSHSPDPSIEVEGKCNTKKLCSTKRLRSGYVTKFLHLMEFLQGSQATTIMSICSPSLTRARSKSHQIMTDLLTHTSIHMNTKCISAHSTVINFLLKASHNHIAAILPM